MVYFRANEERRASPFLPPRLKRDLGKRLKTLGLLAAPFLRPDFFALDFLAAFFAGLAARFRVDFRVPVFAGNRFAIFLFFALCLEAFGARGIFLHEGHIAPRA